MQIASSDEQAANKAIQMIKDLTASAEVNKTYLGTVTRIVDFGAFVEIFPGTRACCTSARSPSTAFAASRTS